MEGRPFLYNQNILAQWVKASHDRSPNFQDSGKGLSPGGEVWLREEGLCFFPFCCVTWYKALNLSGSLWNW